MAGRVYRVSYSPDLVRWFGFGAAGEVTATAGVSEFTDPTAAASPRRFYQVEVVP